VVREGAARRILVIGRGRLGCALAKALRAAGEEVAITSGRAPARAAIAASRVVILAVPDPAIEASARALAGALSAGAVVLHVAGSRGPELLACCRAAGASVGVAHPLVSFAGGARAPRLEGTSFVLAGDRAALRAGARIAKALGARAIRAGVHGPAYHAAAALAANGAAALAAHAVEVLTALGLRRREAERAVGALLGTVAENVARVGVPRALTGPIARGDAVTVAAHRAALRAYPGAARAYDAIAPAILAIARAAGLPSRAAASVALALRAPRSVARGSSRSPRNRGKSPTHAGGARSLGSAALQHPLRCGPASRSLQNARRWRR
jgi:predicted short-subunit dehydrogenase-like oxidoreductase (DUF2520 family)